MFIGLEVAEVSWIYLNFEWRPRSLEKVTTNFSCRGQLGVRFFLDTFESYSERELKTIPVSLQFLASKSIAPVKRCVYRKNFKLRKIIELAEEIHIEQSVWHPA